MYVDKLPPHDINAEESVIGSVLIDGDSIHKVLPVLRPTDFYGEKNRWCYEAFLALAERGEAINQITVSHELSLNERLEEIGGSAYLSHLVIVVPTSVHIEHYAGIVQRTSTYRQIIDASGEIAEIGLRGGSDADKALSRAENILFQVRTRRRSGDFLHVRDVLDDYMGSSAALAPTSDGLSPVPTGFRHIDEQLGNGMQRSDLIIVAARPSLGKSTLAFNIARAAAGEGNRVGIFSLEMSRDQIALRLLAAEAGIDSYRVRVGLLTTDEEARMIDAIGSLSDLPLYIDDTAIQSVADMRGKARRLQSERGLDLLVIDYLQLIAGGNRRIDNRVQEMGEISRSLKGIARDFDIPVVACSQLSRAIEQRPNHRPLLSDLRESGSIEQDADVVAFIHREDVYSTREDWLRRNPTQPYPENLAELIFAKHRNGPVGTVKLYFKNDFMSFFDVEEQKELIH